MLEAAAGTIAARTTVGTTTVTGFPFQPVAVIFWCSLRTTLGVGPTSSTSEVMVGWDCNSSGGIGASQPCCASAWAKDNVVTSVTGGASTTNFAIQLGGTGVAYSAESQALVSSWNADGFTLTYSSAASQAWLINYLAIGGTSVTNARSGAFLLSTSAANQSTSVPGFQPDFLIMAHGNSDWGFGMASSSAAADQATFYSINAPGESPPQTLRGFSAGSVQGGCRAFGVSPPRTLEVDYLVSLNSFDANGFTLAKSNTPAGTRGINYLVLEGGTHKVGVEETPAVTGFQTVPVAVPNVSGLFMGSDTEPAGSTVFDMKIAVGGGTESAYGSSLYAAEDATINTVVEQAASGDGIITGFDYSPDITSAADIQSLDDQSFTLDWTQVSGDEEQFIYWAMGVGPDKFIPQFFRVIYR